MNHAVPTATNRPRKGQEGPEIPGGPVTEPSAWTSKELAADDSWIVRLTADHVAELHAAVDAVKARGLGPYAFGREDFPLPALAAVIDGVVHGLEHGRGCALIKGLDVTNYDEPTLKTLYWGIGVHLGMPIPQNARGDLIGHVRDTGRDFQTNNVRGYTTNDALPPHCDPTDVVGLLCAHPAKQGGDSIIASAMAIFNDIRANNPEYLEPLCAGFHFDLRGEGVTGEADEVTFNRVPVFSWFAGRLSCRYNRRTIVDGQRKAGQPLSGLALEAVEHVARLVEENDTFRFALVFETGDIQLLNNHVVLHSRSAFEDHPEPERRRNLLRIWLNLRDGRPLAPEFADRLNTGPRGGVFVPSAA